jgi:hypothetical protein
MLTAKLRLRAIAAGSLIGVAEAVVSMPSAASGLERRNDGCALYFLARGLKLIEMQHLDEQNSSVGDLFADGDLR